MKWIHSFVNIFLFKQTFKTTHNWKTKLDVLPSNPEWSSPSFYIISSQRRPTIGSGSGHLFLGKTYPVENLLSTGKIFMKREEMSYTNNNSKTTMKEKRPMINTIFPALSISLSFILISLFFQKETINFRNSIPITCPSYEYRHTFHLGLNQP